MARVTARCAVVLRSALSGTPVPLLAGLGATLLAGFGATLLVERAAAAAVMSQQGESAVGAQIPRCLSTMRYDAGSGRCRTPQRAMRRRSAFCRSGWRKVPREYGGYECQRSSRRREQVGTRRVYSHTTHERVWMSSGSRRVFVRTDRRWVPSRTTTTPVNPPIRVRSGTRNVRRCSYDSFAGPSCWYEGVPTYRWITTNTVTTPGRYETVPIYNYQPTGYWHTKPTRHYRNQPIYQTKTSWQTEPAVLQSCPSGWTQRYSRCERSFLGEPSAEPEWACPPTFSLNLGGICEEAITPKPENKNPSQTSNSAEDDVSPGGRLTDLSDAELDERGLQRCGELLSYVACGSLPEREWDERTEACDGIGGVAYTDDHGGSCVTRTDTLRKCAQTGDCGAATVRTFCPAIAKLHSTEIQTSMSPRGVETYRVCVFVCDPFSSLPLYVRQRILQAPDYACADTVPASTTTVPTVTVPAVTVPVTTVPTVTVPAAIVPTTVPVTTVPTSTIPASTVSNDKKPTCISPTLAAIRSGVGAVGLVSSLRVTDQANSPQRHLPGGGEFLVVAPGESWVAIDQSGTGRKLVEHIDTAGCVWKARRVHVAWRELVPWRAADRAEMSRPGVAPHLVEQWNALDSQSRSRIRRWHRSAVDSKPVICDIGATQSEAGDCGWELLRPAVFAWSIQIEYVAQRDGVAVRGVASSLLEVAAGFEWVRSLSSYSAGTVAFASGG